MIVQLEETTQAHVLHDRTKPFSIIVIFVKQKAILTNSVLFSSAEFRSARQVVDVFVPGGRLKQRRTTITVSFESGATRHASTGTLRTDVGRATRRGQRHGQSYTLQYDTERSFTMSSPPT